MKFAFVKSTKTWVVAGPNGWTGPDGSVLTVHAANTHTSWFATLQQAKEAGFSPSSKQAEIIASWSPKAKTVDVDVKTSVDIKQAAK